jgi:hypothetical protein
MANNLDRILDECIDRLNRGGSLEDCLADYPDYVAQLKPLLRAMLETKEAYSFVPSPRAKRSAWQRFNAARQELERRREERQPVFPSLPGWSRVLATTAAVLLIAVIGYFGLRPVLFPGGPVPQPGPGSVTPGPQPGPPPIVTVLKPSPEGNFIFLISDDVNAIGDFESVNVSISRIGLLSSGDSNEWLEFEPELTEVDLTLVPGDKTKEIWRGNVPANQYTKVFIQVTDVHGVLKATGEEVEIKLPSQKLHISKQFQIMTDTVTSFTYDLTVKPQVDQSGAGHKPIESKEKAKGGGENSKKPSNKEASLTPSNLPYSEPSTKVIIHWPDTFSVLAFYISDSIKLHVL